MQEITAPQPKQAEAFPEDKRRTDLIYDIPEAYDSASRGLPKIGEQAKFFKTFCEFVKVLDCETDFSTVVNNLDVAAVKAAELVATIQEAQRNLKKARELEDELRDVEAKLGVPLEQRWSGSKSHQPEDYDFEGEDEEEEEDGEFDDAGDGEGEGAGAEDDEAEVAPVGSAS